MSFRSEHIHNDFMSREQTVRQADTQYALITIYRTNQGYTDYYSGDTGIPCKSKYPELKQYNNKFKKDSYFAWSVYHIEALPQESVLKDKSYDFTVEYEGKTEVDHTDTKSKKKKSSKKSDSKSNSGSTSGSSNSTSNDDSSSDTTSKTTTVTKKESTVTIHPDVDYLGKPTMERKVAVRKTKGLKYGVMEITYDAPEYGDYNIEYLYSSNEDNILENDIYIDGVKQKRPHTCYGYYQVMNRYIQRAKLQKGKHTISFKIDSRTIIYALGVRKVETFKADTLNDNYLTLNSFSLDKSEEFNVTEATVDLFYSDMMVQKGKPYYTELNNSGYLFDYRDEINIQVKDNTGKLRRIFGGYISSISLDEDGLDVTLNCADRLIDCQNKYTFLEMNYDGGSTSSNVVSSGDSSTSSDNNYSSSRKRYFQREGDMLEYLAKTTETPLQTNIDEKGYFSYDSYENKYYSPYTYGGDYDYKLLDSHITDKDKKNDVDYGKKADWNYELATAKNIIVSNDSSSSKTKTPYIQLRNGARSGQHQEITIWDPLYSKGGIKPLPKKYLNINNHPYFVVEYGLGDPKSTYQVCTTTETNGGSDVVGDSNGFGDGTVTMDQIAAVGASFHYGGAGSGHDPIKAWNMYHMNKGCTGDCYDVTAWAYYVYNFKAGIWARDIVGRGDAGSGTHHVIQIRSNGKWVFPEWYHRCTTNLRLTDEMKQGKYHVARDVPTGRFKYPAYRNPWYGNHS